MLWRWGRGMFAICSLIIKHIGVHTHLALDKDAPLRRPPQTAASFVNTLKWRNWWAQALIVNWTGSWTSHQKSSPPRVTVGALDHYLPIPADTYNLRECHCASLVSVLLTRSDGAALAWRASIQMTGRSRFFSSWNGQVESSRSPNRCVLHRVRACGWRQCSPVPRHACPAETPILLHRAHKLRCAPTIRSRPT